MGDVDGDGLDDLYVCQPGGLPNRLYLRARDGTAVESAARAGVDTLDVTSSALILDLDGDGDRDLAAAMADEIVFFANDGEGRFVWASAHAAPMAMSMAAADYDGDGDLDLYVCCYVSPYGDANTPLPYHDANNGQRNVLLRNGGGFRFDDVTADSGLEANNRRFSFACSHSRTTTTTGTRISTSPTTSGATISTATRTRRRELRPRRGRRFVDVAAEAGVEDVAAGMGVSVGGLRPRRSHGPLRQQHALASAGVRC